eukprot:s1881_g4.t1
MYTLAVAGMVLAMACMASSVLNTTMCEDSSFVQLQKSNHFMGNLVSSIGTLEHAEELQVWLRQMAMLKVANGSNTSARPNYTVFKLDENASEATLQMITDSMQSFLDQVNTSHRNDLQEIQFLLENAKACNQDLRDQQVNLDLNVTSVNDNVVAAEIQHDLCRVSENQTYNPNVTAFNALKSTVDTQLQRADPAVFSPKSSQRMRIASAPIPMAWRVWIVQGPLRRQNRAVDISRDQQSFAFENFQHFEAALLATVQLFHTFSLVNIGSLQQKEKIQMMLGIHDTMGTTFCRLI